MTNILLILFFILLLL